MMFKVARKAFLLLFSLGTALFWSLYKEWLSLSIFSTLTQDQTFKIMIVCLSGAFVFLVLQILRLSPNAPGGKGGNAKARNGGIAKGGAGGAGGIGPGGAGGDAVADGDRSFSLGGEGGEGAQPDRPARGGRGPFEVLGNGDKIVPGVGRLGDFGRGGDSGFGDTPSQSGGPGLVKIEYLGPEEDAAATSPK